MTKRAVFVSDLHLSTNSSLDDFTRDDEFEALLELPELRPDSGGVDLVLLGDTFDLWQSVSDAECEASKSSKIPLDYDGPSEAKRLDEVRARHPRWFDALGKYLRNEGARVVFVVGNHDHALVAPDVQEAIARHLGLPRSSPKLAFPGFYEDTGLALYADHGSQYDHNNEVADFSELEWKRDSAGYYFVKLFFNRIEHRDPRIENSPSGWAGVWHWLRRVANFRLLAAAIRFFWQYWTDRRVPRRLSPARAVGIEAGAGGEPRRAPEPEPRVVADSSAPLLLVRGVEGRKRGAGNFFAEDGEMEQFFREAYERSPEVRMAVNEILDARRGPTRAGGRRRAAPGGAAARRAALSRRHPEVPRPTVSRPVPAARTRKVAGPPSDVEWAERLFTDKPYFRDRLSRDAFRFVVFGHTHGELTHDLSNGATYLNTGSWTSPKGPLPVVIAEAGTGGPTARLAHLSSGQIV